MAQIVKNLPKIQFNPWIQKIPWRRKWQPTPVFLPEEFHGRRSLVGYSPWGCKESDTTEVTAREVIKHFFFNFLLLNLKELAYSDWLLLLRNMHIRFFCLFSWSDSPFVCVCMCAEKYSIVWLYQFIYPFSYWRTFWWPLSFGCYNECCYQQLCAHFCVDISFQVFKY